MMKASKRLSLILLIAILWSGCGPKPDDEGGDGGSTGGGSKGSPSATASPSAPAPDVVVQPVEEKNIKQYGEFAARTEAPRTVNLTSQVQGYLLDFSFKEGQFVQRGQVLFRVDPREYEANVASAVAQAEKCRADLAYAKNQVDLKKAQADLASSLAKLRQTQQDVDRYKPLAFRSVIPMQTYDNAVSARDVAKAQVVANQAVVDNTRLSDAANIEIAQAQLDGALAAVAQARLQLSYCTITSPIDGIIGKLAVSPGNLVRVGDPVLATISESNPMYVNFSISENDYLHVYNERINRGARPFELLLGDGSRYPERGTLQMVDRAIDQQTGTLNIRTQFLNPTGILKPGQFARIRVMTQQTAGALLVPQRAIVEIQNVKAAYVVNGENKVEQRNLILGNTYENYYIVKDGLKVGENVIVEGVQKVRDGMVVKPSRMGQAEP